MALHMVYVLNYLTDMFDICKHTGTLVAIINIYNNYE